MNKHVIFRIVIWSCVAVALLVVLVMGIAFGGKIKFFDLGKRELHEIYTTSIDSKEFDSVDIHWHSGNVQIHPSEDDQMRLVQRSYYNATALKCDVTDKCLKIQENSGWRFFFFGFSSRSSNLDLWLPSKQYKDFVFKMTSGDTNMSGISAANINFELTSGKIKAEALQAGKMSADITSGNVNVTTSRADSLSVGVTSGNANFSGSYAAVKGETTSGKVYIQTEAVPESLKAHLTSGKISIAIPDNDGFTLNYKKTSGDIKSDFDLLSSINNKKGSYTYRAGGSAGLEYSAEITSGTFELLKIK